MIRLFKNNLLSNSHKKPVLSKFTSMQELEIKNWIIFEKYETILTLSESEYKIILHTFCQSSYQTILKLTTILKRYYNTRHFLPEFI